MLQMLGAFAEFERSMVRERTRLGLQAARERGRVGDRSPKLTPHQRAEAIKDGEQWTDDWWQHKEGVIAFQNEIIKFLYYRLKY